MDINDFLRAADIQPAVFKGTVPPRNEREYNVNGIVVAAQDEDTIARIEAALIPPDHADAEEMSFPDLTTHAVNELEALGFVVLGPGDEAKAIEYLGERGYVVVGTPGFIEQSQALIDALELEGRLGEERSKATLAWLESEKLAGKAPNCDFEEIADTLGFRNDSYSDGSTLRERGYSVEPLEGTDGLYGLYRVTFRSSGKNMCTTARALKNIVEFVGLSDGYASVEPMLKAPNNALDDNQRLVEIFDAAAKAYHHLGKPRSSKMAETIARSIADWREVATTEGSEKPVNTGRLTVQELHKAYGNMGVRVVMGENKDIPAQQAEEEREPQPGFGKLPEVLVAPPQNPVQVRFDTLPATLPDESPSETATESETLYSAYYGIANAFGDFGSIIRRSALYIAWSLGIAEGGARDKLAKEAAELLPLFEDVRQGFERTGTVVVSNNPGLFDRVMARILAEDEKAPAFKEMRSPLYHDPITRGAVRDAIHAAKRAVASEHGPLVYEVPEPEHGWCIRHNCGIVPFLAIEALGKGDALNQPEMQEGSWYVRSYTGQPAKR